MKLTLEKTKSGDVTACCDGRWIHSRYDPRREARQWASKQIKSGIVNHTPASVRCIVLLGPGFGYAIDALLEELQTQGYHRINEIHCVEAISDVAYEAQRLKVWRKTEANIKWHSLETASATIGELRERAGTITLKCQASFPLAQDAYLKLIDIDFHVGKAMRVLVPTPLYGGSLPTALHCAEALRELGHEVELLDLQSFYPMYQYAECVSADRSRSQQLQTMLVEFLAHTIVERAVEFRADLIWSVAQTPLTPAALRKAKAENIASAFWFVEDWRRFPYWQQVGRYYDAIFTIQRGEFHMELKQAGAKHVCYLPCAANPRVHYPEQASSDHWASEVSFVGAGYPNRQLIFDRLNLPNFKIWGSDWPQDSSVCRYVQQHGRRVTTAETRAIFNNTSINLNIHSSTSADDAQHGDFVNPRTFEIASCGAFQLVDRRALLGELFIEGKECVVFDHSNELPKLIHYYLTHPEERKEIANRARERVLREHTYVHRMSTAIGFIQDHVLCYPQQNQASYVESLIEAAGDDSEIVEFLTPFQNNTETSLDTIADSIELGKGPLTRAQGVFLLMKEFRDWGREKGVIS